MTVLSVEQNQSPWVRFNSHETQVSINFVLPNQVEGVIRNAKVCRPAFSGILQESRDRMQRLCKKYLQEVITPAESCGGTH